MHKFQAALVFCVLAMKIEFFRNAVPPMPLHALVKAEGAKLNERALNEMAVHLESRKKCHFLRKNHDFSQETTIFSLKIFADHFPEAKTRFSTIRDRENMR